MTADPVGDDVLSRLADTWAAKTKGGQTPTGALVEVLFGLDLAIVPRAQTVKTGGWTPPVVTVGSLVHAASERAADLRWAAADALLLHAAMSCPSIPEMATYRAVLSAMELLHAAGREANLEALAEVAGQAYTALVDRLDAAGRVDAP